MNYKITKNLLGAYKIYTEVSEGTWQEIPTPTQFSVLESAKNYVAYYIANIAEQPNEVVYLVDGQWVDQHGGA